MFGRWIGLAAMGVALAAATSAVAQQCDDFNMCTQNDMCVAGQCTGTPVSSGTCDDFNECTTNDRCTVTGCMGDPAVGAPCAGGCGTCQNLSPVPGFEFVVCVGDSADDGAACDASIFGPCLTGTCLIEESGPDEPAIAFCAPAPVECPEADNCRGACNPATGQCDNSLSRCFGVCERCNTETNECEPANLGVACDDFNPCTESSCQAEDINGQLRGICFEGTPSAELPTPTATQPGAATPTRTPGEPLPCVGDCNYDGMVVINELIIGVNLALGGSTLNCTAFDTNDDGEVSINELIAAVNSALSGCVI